MRIFSKCPFFPPFVGPTHLCLRTLRWSQHKPPKGQTSIGATVPGVTTGEGKEESAQLQSLSLTQLCSITPPALNSCCLGLTLRTHLRVGKRLHADLTPSGCSLDPGDHSPSQEQGVQPWDASRNQSWGTPCPRELEGGTRWRMRTDSSVKSQRSSFEGRGMVEMEGGPYKRNKNKKGCRRATQLLKTK